tara:strand:+ start:297 stop:590 length:294 start_codon:yes stop_codon:yes gene_type:complete
MEENGTFYSTKTHILKRFGKRAHEKERAVRRPLSNEESWYIYICLDLVFGKRAARAAGTTTTTTTTSRILRDIERVTRTEFINININPTSWWRAKRM